MKATIQLLLAAASAALLAAGPVQAACVDCGTVVEVKTVKKGGEASGGGAVVGGIVGGVIGHQIGSGRGNTAATVAGAAGGAYAGHQIEKNKNTTSVQQVVIKLDNGKSRTFEYASATSYKVGDPVKVVDNKLVRR